MGRRNRRLPQIRKFHATGATMEIGPIRYPEVMLHAGLDRNLSTEYDF
jgi:hypothetical protein